MDGGQEVRFEGEAGATYRLSLVDSFHDSIPVLVVARESDGAFVADSEPRMADLRVAPWQMEEGWHIVDWRRYRHPDAAVDTDVALYQYPVPEDVMGEWSGATWISSVGLETPAYVGERFALASDLALDLELDYANLNRELVNTEPRVERFVAIARKGGQAVSGYLAVARVDGVLRGMSCVGPGPWALRARGFQEQLARAVERAR